MCNQVMHRQGAATCLPPLEHKMYKWCKDLAEKADVLAECWSEKFQLPPERYEQAFFAMPDAIPASFAIRARSARRLPHSAKIRLQVLTI